MSDQAAQLRELCALFPPHGNALRAVPPLRDLCQAIRLEGRIDESLQAPPSQAGPLNSQGVTVRALHRLNHLSPAYLRHFEMQMDALAALEDLSRRGAG
jgi:hypothetical protein